MSSDARFPAICRMPCQLLPYFCGGAELLKLPFPPELGYVLPTWFW
jgi:hypothetical protein